MAKPALKCGRWGAILLAMAAASPSAAAPDTQSGTALPAECDGLKTLAVPSGDAPPASMAASLKGCSSEALYYGIGVPKDPVRARQCAYLERQDPDAGWPNLFAATGMLMTIYANGIGASRNLDLAMKFACEIDGAPAEEEGWIAHLQKLKSEHWQGRDFSPCDDITSGAAMGFCEAHEAKLADAVRAEKLADITAGWSGAERKSFAALDKAKNAYAAAVAENEVDMSGTARGALFIAAKEAADSQFLATLEKTVSGTLPSVSPSDFAEADNKLNALYQKIQKSSEPSGWGTVTKEGIQKTECIWLAYRDAFVDFAKRKFPSLAPESLKLVLTQDRIKSLENFAS
ncbi:MAG TPA: lysozyme inhibitor LprI family protein [Methylocella sp.]|nr:lysozyme inhibitor LprI family protein [Methylocella sp.]